jgi:hypothetical protein
VLYNIFMYYVFSLICLANNCYFSSSQQLDFLMHLHCLIVIFTLFYYYIYDDFFSVIYWTK